MKHDNLLNSLSLVFCLSVSSILAFSGNAEAIGLDNNGDQQAHATPLTEMTKSSARSESPVIFHDRFEELPDLTAEEAEQVFDELARRTGVFIEAAFAEAQESEGSTGAFTRETEVFDIDFDQECSDGGTVSVAGSISVTEGDGDEQTTDMNLSLEYQACDEQGVLIDGDLSYQNFLWRDGNDMDMSLAMFGQLEFSGDIEASCGIDVTIEVMMTEVEEHQFDIDVYADGHFCGYDFGDLDTQITDPNHYGGGP